VKCFYHNDRPAVGICKSCNKGICLDCYVDVGNGLACKNNCEEAVSAINTLVNRSIALSNNRKALNRPGMISFARNLISFGLILSGLALFVSDIAPMLVLGVVVFVLGVLLLVLNQYFVKKAIRKIEADA